MTSEKNINNNNSESLSLRDIWEMLISNIWLFVASGFFALLVAVFYLMSTTPIYRRTATILIKDDEKGLAPSNGIGEINLFKNNVNVMNEIDIIQTPSLMQEVVRRLDLTNYYSVRSVNRLRWSSLYLNSPFSVNSEKVDNERYFYFEVEIDDEKNYTLSDIKIFIPTVKKPLKIKGEIKGEFGVPLEGELSGIVISSNIDKIKDPEKREKIFKRKYRFFNNSVKNTSKNYLAALSVILRDEDVTIADMRLIDSNPVRAEHILNMLISVYREDWIRKKNVVTLSSSDFISKRLDIIQRELGNVDQLISDFKSENLIPDIPAVTKLQLTKVSGLNDKLQFYQDQLSMAKYLQRFINDKETVNQPLPLNIGLNHEAIELQIKQYNDLILERNLYSSISSEKNPIVADLIVNIKAVRDVLNSSISEQVNSLELQLKLAEDEILKNKELLASGPKQTNELLSSERQRSVKEQLYLFLLQKREENELTQAFTAYNIEVLDYADGSPNPISPSKRLTLLIALFMGVVLPFAYILIRDALDTYVKGRSDLAFLKVPLLGTIPRIVELKKKKVKEDTPSAYRSLIVGESNRSVANEAFRVVRTNLDFMRKLKDSSHVIQSISFNPNSGKTFITLNLAMSMALKGEKVLIIDGDIRKATLSDNVGLRGARKGLSEYLHGDCTLDQIIVKGVVEGRIDVIPVGVIPPNPSELLLSENLEKLITEVKKNYKYIFFDCPPVDIVPDSAIIAPFCNTTLFVLRAGLADKRLLPELDAIYEDGRFNGMCLMLNDVQYQGSSYYGHHRYGYYGAYEK